VGTSGPRDVIASIRAARKELEAGHVVCIFAEGSIAAPEISCRSNAAWRNRRRAGRAHNPSPIWIACGGSIFSFESGRFLFIKWPKRIPYPVTVSFGKPMPSTSDAHAVRQALLELG